MCGYDSGKERKGNGRVADGARDWYRPRNDGAGADYNIADMFDGQWRYDVGQDHPMYWLYGIPTIVRATRADVEAHDGA